MMLRAARTTDVFRLVELIEQQQSRSRYAGSVGVDAPYARKLLAQAIQRHGGRFDGASLVNVITDGEGVIQSFCVGVLNRVYMIGDLLCAQDMFLVATPEAPKMSGSRLLSAYVEWAITNPHVFEIQLSHTDAVPESDRIGAVYERMGFEKCGAVYRRGVEHEQAKEAA